MTMAAVLALLVIVLWDMFIWAGTVDLIVNYGWSAWWLVLTVILTVLPQGKFS